MQNYFDPTRADDPYSLPDCEVFYLEDGEQTDENGEALPAGWYWWACLPGCLPDSDPYGPCDTEEEALADAQDY